MSEAPVKYGDNGDVYVWTGTGYQLIPRIAQSDIALNAAKDPYTYTQGESDVGVAGTPQEATWANADAASKYGMPGDWGYNSNNWQTNWNGDPNSFDLKLKSADKVGSNIQYTLKDGYWTPQVTGSEYWDTNGSLMDKIGPLLPIGAALGAAYLPGLLGGAGAAEAAPGAMTTFGTLDTSLALPGTTFASGVGAAGGAIDSLGLTDLYGSGGAAGGAAGEGLGLAGTYGSTALTPEMLSQGLGGLAGVDALGGVAGSDLLSAFGAGDLLSGVGAGSSALDNIGKFIKDNPSLVKAGGVLAGGLLGGATDNQQQGGSAPATNVTPPTMYGGSGGMIGNFAPMGNTETERRMRKDYLPGLLGGQNPWGY